MPEDLSRDQLRLPAIPQQPAWKFDYLLDCPCAPCDRFGTFRHQLSVQPAAAPQQTSIGLNRNSEVLPRSKKISDVGRLRRTRFTPIRCSGSSQKAGPPLRVSVRHSSRNSSNHRVASGRNLSGVGIPQTCASPFSTEQNVRSSERNPKPCCERANASVDFPAPDGPARSKPSPASRDTGTVQFRNANRRANDCEQHGEDHGLPICDVGRHSRRKSSYYAAGTEVGKDRTPLVKACKH